MSISCGESSFRGKKKVLVSNLSLKVLDLVSSWCNISFVSTGCWSVEIIEMKDGRWWVFFDRPVSSTPDICLVDYNDLSDVMYQSLSAVVCVVGFGAFSWMAHLRSCLNYCSASCNTPVPCATLVDSLKTLPVLSRLALLDYLQHCYTCYNVNRPLPASLVKSMQYLLDRMQHCKDAV